MDDTQRTGTTQEPTRSLLPRLSLIEWLVFGLLAAMLAVVNIYSTLLIGWGDGGSIIAVIASIMVLSLFGKKTSLENLNLSQTMVSAGGSVGFAVASYAAVLIVNPDFAPSRWVLGFMFFGMSILGTLVGSSVRTYMVRYYFPSGTACAVIQRTVSEAAAGGASSRPIRLLSIWGSIAAAITVPVKITLAKGGGALLSAWQWTTVKGVNLGVSPEPLLYGIGIVVGPRIGFGMLIGALSPILINGALAESAIPADQSGLWVRWIAVAVLTLPTFASILFGYLFRTPPVIPAGFTPGSVTYGAPPARSFVYAGLGLVGLIVTALCAQVAFNLSYVVVVLAVAVSWPLCVINGRVTGETDINPVRLVALSMLSIFAFFIAKDAVVLLGVAIIGATLAGMAVDMMQDYRTGYLVNGNPHHQTSVQFIGAAIGAVVAVPFFFLVIAKMGGVGPDSALAAPGATVWATVAKSLTGDNPLTAPLLITTAIVSIVFSGFTFFNVWPKTQALTPSVFGVGIGLLLSFDVCFAIFLGGLIKWGATEVYKRTRKDVPAPEAMKEASTDTMLVGSSIFAASALLTVILVGLVELQRVLDVSWFWIATH